MICRARRIKRYEEERRCAVRHRTDSAGTSPCTAENSTGKAIEKGQTAAEPAGVKKESGVRNHGGMKCVILRNNVNTPMKNPVNTHLRTVIRKNIDRRRGGLFKKGCRFRYRKIEIIARMIKMITSHFAMVIENPATPFAPNTYATSAKMRNNTANPIKSATIHLL
ncbi:hypothetical protein J2T58_001562 [Methanocalculus alkaliphilus]|nr:hypothetical protein [Methanocalculus alkaliphilus]